MISETPSPKRTEALRSAFRPSYEVYEQPEIYQVAFARSLSREFAFFDAACKAFSDGPPKRVLDVGCGTGLLAIECARRGWQTTGIDVNENMVAFACREARRQGLRADFHVANMESHRLESPVDAAFCATGTVHHLTTQRGLQSHLAAMARNLRPGGLYFLDLQITRPRDEPIEIQQSWTVAERQWEIRVKMEFPPTGFDLKRRRRWAILEVLVWNGREERLLRNAHWMRVFFENEFSSLVQAQGFRLLGWFVPDKDPRRRVREPANYPMVYAVLQKPSGLKD